MKIIDEKGRIFGKINVIDFLVIAFLITLIPAIYFIGKITIERNKRNLRAETFSFVELELYYKFTKAGPEIAKLIAVGDKEITKDGQVIGEITWVGENEPYQYKINVGDREIIQDDPELREIPVRIKMKVLIKENNVYYKNRQVAINSAIDFKTDRYALEAVAVTEEEIAKTQRLEMEMSCKFIEVDPEISRLIAVGDKEITKNGETIGEITWVGESEPYQYKINVGDREIIQDNPELREIPVRIKIKTLIKENNIYYKNRQVAINSAVDFKTDKYNLEVVPLKEEEIKRRKEIEYRTKIVRTVKVDLNISFKNLSEETVKLFSIGDSELGENGKVVAEVLDLGRIENNNIKIDLSNDNFINVEDRSKKQISAKMRLMTDIDEGANLYFKNAKVTYNSPIQFKTNKYIVEGVVAQILTKEKWLHIQVRFSGVLPEVANLLKEGDEEKNSAGGLLAVLKKIITNEPTKIQTLIVQDKEFIAISSPFQRDIIADLDLLCQEKDIGLFFKDYPVKVGNIIVFTTDLYSLSGTIINLEIK